jgi:hypothetical protein
MKLYSKALMGLAVIAMCASMAFADSLSISGPAFAGHGLGLGNGQQAVFMSFTASTSQTNLSMDAVLNSFSASQTVTWWLTDAVGAGATNSNVLDTGSVLGPSGSCCTGTTANVNIFSGINIGPGTYYVVLTTTGQGNETGWNFTSNAAVATGGLSYNFTGLTSQQSGSFAPGYSGYFNAGDNVEFNLTSDQAINTPEPASLALLGSGLIGAGSFVRRKLIN